LGLLALALAPLRVVSLESEGQKGFFILNPFSKIKVQFINSVTHGPVTITFYPVFRFGCFSMTTDEATEDYYTFGTYRMSGVLSGENRGSMVFCSEEGMVISIGGRNYEVKGECKKISLIWPP
jgi:hypothetical protein